MGYLGPLHLVDAAHSPCCLEDRTKTIGTDENCRYPPAFELHLVEQTARATTPSITVGEHHRVAVVDARPFVCAHHASRVIAATYESGDVVPRTQHCFDLIHELDSIELHVGPETNTCAVERSEPRRERTGDDHWLSYRIDKLHRRYLPLCRGPLGPWLVVT